MQVMRWRKQSEGDINGARPEFSFGCDVGSSERARESERTLSLDALECKFYKLA